MTIEELFEPFSEKKHTQEDFENIEEVEELILESYSIEIFYYLLIEYIFTHWSEIVEKYGKFIGIPKELKPSLIDAKILASSAIMKLYKNLGSVEKLVEFIDEHVEEFESEQIEYLKNYAKDT